MVLEWIFVLVIAGKDVPASHPIALATCQRMQSLTSAQSKCVKTPQPLTGGTP